MRILAAILALLTGAAGWYYLFYSTAAHRLGEVEGLKTNRQRIMLRRINAVAMLLLAVCFFMLFWTVGDDVYLVMVLGIVLLLLVVVMGLALIDLRMTLRLRREHKRQRDDVGTR